VEPLKSRAEGPLFYFLGQLNGPFAQDLYCGPAEQVRAEYLVYKALQNYNTCPALWIEKPSDRKRGIVDETANLILMCEFAWTVEKGHEYKYKVTVALTDAIREFVESELLLSSDHDRFVGIVFPSRNFNSMSNNIVVFPELTKGLKLEEVVYLQINNTSPGSIYSVSMLDYANRFGADGCIEWQGAKPWRQGVGAVAKFCLEFGSWLGRDITGRKIGSDVYYHHGWDELT
jgi:hypothetical protein